MLVIGHRGARNEAPENTLAGFAYAKRLGLDGVEFDVRLSSDGQLVVIHDATVDRTTNGHGAVSDFTAVQLANLDARAQFPDWKGSCGVPLLTEVLDVLGDDLRMMIEIKKDTPGNEERIIHGVMQELGLRGLMERATLTSFDTVALEIVQREFPDQRRGYIGAWDSEEFIETAQRLGCAHGDAHRTSASPAVIAKAQDSGMTMLGWMCDTREEFDLLSAWGVDAVTTDNPGVILALRGALTTAAW